MKTLRLYQNRKWLENKYLKEKLSTVKIAKLCKVSDSCIGRNLKKNNVQIRSRAEAAHLSKANHCNLSQKAIEWINGELLGDGNLNCQHKSFYSAGFTYGSKYLEYIQYVSDTLNSFGIKQVGKIRKYYNKQLDCCYYNYSSRYYVELLVLKKMWYPEGKKIIPKNLKLTPLTCRQWHIGDGCLIYAKKWRPYIGLATCGFLISDVEWLVKQLIKLGLKATRQITGNRIYISTKSTKQFINYIGKCPVKCYQYKFNYETG